MPKTTSENTRLKRDYLTWMKQAHGRSDTTVDAAAQALARFEEYTRQRPFKKFHRHQAIGFKAHLQDQVNARTGLPLSNATVSAVLAHVRDFFVWLADRPGYRRVVTHSDAAYFSLTEREERVANATTSRPRPTLQQLLHILQAMPNGSVVERRDRAVVAFVILTGARDGTLPGLRLRHVNLAELLVHFDPRDVHTKFGKEITTWFFPVPPPVETIVRDWIDELRDVHHFGPDEPLFPQTEVGLDAEKHFGVRGIARTPWRTARPVRQIFKAACSRVDMPYFNPHGARHALSVLGTDVCRMPEQFKAWSQNLGHDHVLTTFNSYGKVEPARQAELIRGLNNDLAAEAPDLAAEVRQLLQKLDARVLGGTKKVSGHD
jgi:integrase